MSQHSESRTPNLRGEHGRSRRSRHSCSTSKILEPTSNVFSRIRRDGSKLPGHRDSKIEAVFTRLGRKEKGVFNKLGGKGRSVSARSSDSKTQRHRNVQREGKSRYQSFHSRKTEPIPRRSYHERTSSQRTEAFSESKDSRGGHWKSRSKKQKSSIEEDELSQLWVCEEMDPFTPHICYFDFPMIPSNDKTYDGCNTLKMSRSRIRVRERYFMSTFAQAMRERPLNVSLK
ncbi:hypothetical protein Tco_0942835 [Tanacetum coccineum]